MPTPANAEKSKVPSVERDDLSRSVSANHRVVDMRSKVNTLLDTIERQRLATHDHVKEYRKAAEADNSLEGLNGFYKWIAEKQQQALESLNGLHGQINDGIRKGLMSEGDRAFLMQNLILTDKEDFIGKAEVIVKLTTDKIDRMKKDREAYDEIHNHKLVKNTGFLKTDPYSKLEIPDEKAFLKLTVPERRELIEKAKEALPKAERYAEKTGDVESVTFTKKYDELLNKALNKDKIIGAATAKKFREGFKVVDLDEKERWINEFEGQMERYKTLWQNIRGTLKGEDLEGLEKKRDTMGWTELSDAFSDTLCQSYGKKLEGLESEKVISLHTKKAFIADIKAQSLTQQASYFKNLDSQMQRYQALRGDIDQMQDKKAQAELNAMYQSPFAGYSEIHARYNELNAPKNETEKKDADETKMESILQGVKRERVRKNIEKSAGGSGGEKGVFESREQKEHMVHILDRRLGMTNESEHDTDHYTDSIRELRTKKKMDDVRGQADQNPIQKEEASEAGDAGVIAMRDRIQKSRQENAEADSAAPKSIFGKMMAFGRPKKEPETRLKVVTKAEDHFQKTEIDDASQETTVMRMEIGDKEATQAFLKEDLQDRDRLHFMAKDGTVDRLTLQELRAYRDYLKLSLKKPANDNAKPSEKAA